MNTLTVVNMKCEGCQKSVIASLTKAGLTNISVDIATQRVTFEGDPQIARKTLSSLGYPEAGSPAASSLLKKGQSYITCTIGKLS